MFDNDISIHRQLEHIADLSQLNFKIISSEYIILHEYETESNLLSIDKIDFDKMKKKKMPLIIENEYMYIGILNYGIHFLIISKHKLIKDYEISSFEKIAKSIALAHFIITGKDINTQKIPKVKVKYSESIANTTSYSSQYNAEKLEQSIEHYTYKFEKQYLRAIEEGDLHAISSMGLTSDEINDSANKVGKLSNDNIKQLEYLFVSSLILTSRAAIKGGIPPNESYTLSELYLQQLSELKTAEQIIKLQMKMPREFIGKVNDLKRNSNRTDFVEGAKSYIKKNVLNKISVAIIASAINVNANYLSKQFKKIEGVTVTEYIYDQKLIAAKDLIIYTDRSISNISYTLNFSSQSRFGQLFKKKYGVTPFVYRKSKRIADYFE